MSTASLTQIGWNSPKDPVTAVSFFFSVLMDVSSSVLEKSENGSFTIISTAATLVPAATSNHTYLSILAMALWGIIVNCFITYTSWYILYQV